MAEASLNFNESTLDKQSGTYALYSRLLESMRSALLVETPNFVDNPPLTADGEIDNDAIKAALDAYNEIQMKNSAYDMANSIMSTVSGGGGGSGTEYVGFLSRNGDTMVGQLGALYGFQAGSTGLLIFDTSINSSNAKIAHVYGSLIVDENATFTGNIYASNSGIYFNNNQSIYYSDNALHIASSNISLDGEVVLDGSITVGDTIIDDTGIYWGDKEYYHSGNANLSSVDWSAKDIYAAGGLEVTGASVFNNSVIAQNGFSFGVDDAPSLYSESDGSIILDSNLLITSGHAIQIGSNKIIHVRTGALNVVSISAPGMTMNLGDSDGTVKTDHIALQSAIYNYNSSYKIVSEIGDGNFPNSFSAGCGNAGNTVIQTYYTSGSNYGFVSLKNLRFGSSSGPYLSTDTEQMRLVIGIPHTFLLNGGTTRETREVQTTIGYAEATSLYRNLSLESSAVPHFDTQGEYFVFDKWIESPSFTIISEKYKTRLGENFLFFDDGVLIEGVPNGMRLLGDTQYNGTLSSNVYSSGFAGIGWAIEKNSLTGNIAATFDEITVRKKMRIYELEVQKTSATNGSLWISDSCSGDIVEELN